MLLDSKELNRSDILSKNEYYYNENKKYYNTTIKKKKLKKLPNKNNNQDLLIDSLKNFSVKYEIDENKNSKDIKFIITFDELISLIRYTLESQIKLDKILKDETEDLNTLSKDFINELSLYIFSYEKESIKKTNNKNNKSISNKENINSNSGKGRKKKSLCNIISKSPSYWVEEKKSKNDKNEKNDKNDKNDNIQKKSKNEISNNNINDKKNNNNNNNILGSRSYYKRNLDNKLFSPKNANNKAKFENKKKNYLNKSVEKRHNSKISDISNNKDNSKKKKLNNSAARRNSVRADKNKNNKNTLSIYTACQNLKSSSFILGSKTHNISSTEYYNKQETKKNNNYNSNYDIGKCKSKEKNIVYYDHKLKLDVKRQIIVGNILKPSSFANKLLQNGRKFITEFNGIKEEERKKQF